MEKVSKEYAAARRDIYTRFTGHITAFDKQVVILEVQKKTGIAPPPWFKVSGMTLSDVERAATAARRSP